MISKAKGFHVSLQWIWLVCLFKAFYVLPAQKYIEKIKGVCKGVGKRLHCRFINITNWPFKVTRF